ncbi:MAG: aerobic-type carbon monoxide dehydrogenase, middle subunit CoxM/CutM-like protein [Anaerosporomusa subterranea]|jgi:CO/xanthine dehydrogenase FAD-binding subunit|nr:aerobic-type carbon monoxide dehydrogenase, middle subunit CoxM/CutM-like protein [Anaerosporomusa subterranea]
MFTLRSVAQPQTIEEAYKLLIQKRTNAILGGCAFLKLGSQRIDTGIDLTHLGLNLIQEKDGFIEIGASASLRDLETNPVLTQRFSSLLTNAAANIIGVQFRNLATVGASVFSKYGFSDILTALLVLDTQVLLYKGGRMKLSEFLMRPFERDLLTNVFIKADDCQAAYQCLRNSASDYPVLNVAVACSQDQWRIAVGARPGRAALALQAASLLNAEALSDATIEQAAKLASLELSFGTNMRGSAEYRRAMCQTLVKRAIREAIR